MANSTISATFSSDGNLIDGNLMGFTVKPEEFLSNISKSVIIPAVMNKPRGKISRLHLDVYIWIKFYAQGVIIPIGILTNLLSIIVISSSSMRKATTGEKWAVPGRGGDHVMLTGTGYLKATLSIFFAQQFLE